MWIVNALTSSNTAVFDFTESEQCITFVRTDEVVSISATYVECESTCSIGDLVTSTRAFAHRVVDLIKERHPEVSEADAFLQLESMMFR